MLCQHSLLIDCSNKFSLSRRYNFDSFCKIRTLKEKRDFLAKVDSNCVLLDQNIKFILRSAWKIISNLPDFTLSPPVHYKLCYSGKNQLLVLYTELYSSVDYWD